MTTVPQRTEISIEHTWDPHSIFASDEAWFDAMEQAQQRAHDVALYAGRLAEGPDVLLEALQQADALRIQSGHIFYYAFLFYAVDSTDQQAAARLDRAQSLSGALTAQTAFLEPEIIALGADTLHQWANTHAELQGYRHYFDQLLSIQEHVRSAEVEQILGLASDAFNTATSTHSILADADFVFKPAVDSQGQEHEITQGTIGALLTEPDAQLRRSAWEHYADAFLVFKNTVANCISTGVKQHVFTARVRHYDSCLEAALSEDFIPTEVFHQLIATCRKHLPIWHRYWELRRRLQGVEKLAVCDIKAPLTREKLHIPFSKALDLISDGLQPLGAEYIEPMRQGVLEQRWVDIYPNKGKRAGAFSAGWYGTYPFIMMNYNDDVFGLSTLAHELGHSMHSFFTWQSQPAVYGNYTIFVAEVASNFNQALVRDYLFKTVDDRDFQLALIEEAMSNFHRYFFLMPILAQFELEIHERAEQGEPLTADGMIELMADLFAEGYGDAVALDRERVGITWAQFHTHLYANFYVYQYATGIAGAHALADRVLAGDTQARDAYLQFLRSGSSVYPIEVLKRAGVDLTSAEPVEKAFKVLESMVDRLEQLMA